MPKAARRLAHETEILTARLERLERSLHPGRTQRQRGIRHQVDPAPFRDLHLAAATLGLSVLADSAVEHYRGSFKNRAMWLALGSSAANILAGAAGMRRPLTPRHEPRSLAYLAALGIGTLGTGFHLYNVGKRVGGYRWENLFYGAPLGAPGALMLSGLVGIAADRAGRSAQRRGRATILGLPAGRTLAGLTSFGLLGTVAEAGLLHFRGNFQNPGMYVPVTLPPVAAALLGASAVRKGPPRHRLVRGWLRLTALAGFAGSAFHAYGISRAMGGWRNWRQNVVDGPPLPAPPSFSALALAGLAALRIFERSRP